ncbi:MAG: phage distal tail protein, Rcc01695 family [Phyllobacterium sp.]
MAAFHDVRFPPGISFGATGGPEWRNEIVALTSGFEQRNARWAQSRHYYDAGTGLRSLADLDEVMAFFEARRGSLHAFRFRDPFDHLSCKAGRTIAPGDQWLGTGDGRNAAFQLVKRYGDYVRTIAKPQAQTVRAAVDGAEYREGLDFVVELSSGMVVFQPGKIPPVGAKVTAGFGFDVPARFNTDRLTVSIKSFNAGDIPSIPIVEVKV